MQFNSTVWHVSPTEIELLKKENAMLDSLKGYYKKHEEIIFTIGFVLILDYLLFGGALRIKIKSLVEKMLATAEDKLKLTSTPDAV